MQLCRRGQDDRAWPVSDLRPVAMSDNEMGGGEVAGFDEAVVQSLPIRRCAENVDGQWAELGWGKTVEPSGQPSDDISDRKTPRNVIDSNDWPGTRVSRGALERDGVVGHQRRCELIAFVTGRVRAPYGAERAGTKSRLVARWRRKVNILESVQAIAKKLRVPKGWEMIEARIVGVHEGARGVEAVDMLAAEEADHLGRRRVVTGGVDEGVDAGVTMGMAARPQARKLEVGLGDSTGRTGQQD